MVFNKYMLRISVRLLLIFLAMLALVLVIGEQARLFSALGLSLILILLIIELFHSIARTNRIVESLLESIRYGDYNKTIRDKAAGLGFEGLADSAQQIIRAIASARIEKETQYQYLQTILEHIHTAVLTLDEQHEPELINPLALNTLGLYNTRKPTWSEIEKSAPLFTSAVDSMGESGRKMIRLSNTPTGKQLLVLLNTVKIGGALVKIITFQDIEPEIEQKEMESWQTISRIMAHEIMNSLTPLSSLTETGIMLLENRGKSKDVSELSQKTIDNLYTALKTISGRNRALTAFIGSYRQLSRLPAPLKEKVHVAGMLEELRDLYEIPCKEKRISCTMHPGPEQLVVTADPSQIKQVLINMVKNATEAMENVKDPVIELSVKRILHHLSIEIYNNGPAIPPDVLEKIFVPFYSTKPEGSGIGLSLSRQIISNHGGQITVESEEGKGTTFKVKLPVIK
ncbi:MAG: GHKL domain-containing protein [Bacteroidales bacterium]|nr:GHKL domain-containing protein [Bacteroidales bacterium]